VPNRYADCLLKNTSTKDNKYVVNQKLEHVDDISFSEFVGRIRVFFLAVFKTGLQSYCDTSYSRGGVNQTWILKNSKDML
jgi:hypothetical protein